MSDQVSNLFQDQIFFLQGQVFLRDGNLDRNFNKFADIPVNTISATRSDMGTRNFQSDIFRHIAASDSLGNAIQDHGEIYDIAHHASNILLAGTREMSHLVMLLLGVHSPPSVDIANPIRELVSRSVPLRTKGNSIGKTYPLIANTLTSSMRHQPAQLDL